MSDAALRSERRRDALALVLVLVGVVLYLLAYRQMASLAGSAIALRPGETAFDQWARYYYLSRAAMGIVGTGIAVGIWSFWSRGRHRSRRTG